MANSVELVGVLEDLGLSTSESKVFLALIKLGSAKASQIIAETGFQNSVVHLAVGRLMQRGFISFVRRGQVRFFQAANFESLRKKIDARRKSLAGAITELRSLYTPSERQEAAVFEGISGLRAMLYELIEDGKPGDEFLFFAFYHPDPKVQQDIYPIYREFESERLQRKIVLRGLVPEQARTQFKDRKQSTLRYVKFPIPINTNIFRDRVSFSPGGERNTSFLLRSSTLATQYREHFLRLWEICS